MRDAVVAVLALMLLASAFLGLTGSVSAQASAADKLYLTSESAPSPAASSTDCGNLGAPGYTMNQTLTSPETTEKAYVAASATAGLVSVACPTNFRWEATQNAALVGETTVRLFVGCDAAATFQQGTQVGVSLLLGGAQIAQTNITTLPTQCVMGDVLEANASLGPLQTGISSGTALDLQFLFYTSSTQPAQDNVHILVDSTEHPSALIAAGLPGAPRTDQGPENQTNQTNTTSGDENDSPGFSAVATLAAVGGALLAAQRSRRARVSS